MDTITQKICDHADAEIKAGRLWRAKEIFQGSVPNVGYDLDFFAAYGRLLLQMGEDLEAGKLFFFAGLNEQYPQQVALFLNRYRKNPSSIWGLIPACCRLSRLSDYPPNVQHYFELNGISGHKLHSDGDQIIADDGGSKTFAFGCLLVLCLFVILAMFGLGFIIHLIID